MDAYLINRRKKVLDNTFGWIIKNLKYFDITFEYDTIERQLKKLGELMIMVCNYKRKTGNADNAKINYILAFVIKKLNHYKIIDGLMRRPHLWILYAGLYSTILDCGHNLEFFKVSLDKLANQNYLFAKELIPVKQIELSYIFNKIYSRESLSSLYSLYSSSILFKNPSKLFLDKSDVYAMTHIIFYLTDFGFKTIEIPKNDLYNMRGAIQNWIEICLHDKDWDLLAELLICCNCILWFPQPLYSISWKYLLAAQTEDGFIPGPYFDKDKLLSLELNKKEKYLFELNYHTTLLISMACTLINENSNFVTDYMVEINNQLPYDALSISCKNSYDWIQSLSIDYNIDDVSYLLYLLLSEWIYQEGMSSKRSDSIINKGKSIAERIDRLNLPLMEIKCDAALMLLSLGIFRKLKIKCNHLEAYGEVVNITLSKYNPKSDAELIDLFPSLFLNYKLNSIEMSNYNNLQFEVEKAYDNKNYIKNLSSFIAAITNYGKRKIKCDSPTEQNILLSVQSSMNYSLFIYDLDFAFMMMRSMLYLGKYKSKAFAEAIDYIICQQRIDGRMGFFEWDLSHLSEALKYKNEIPLIYLPSTISHMWTMTEIINPKFRLLHTI